MTRQVPTALAISLLLSACCAPPGGSSKSSPAGSTAPATTAAKTDEPAQPVDLKTLLKDYEANEVRADGLYKGKRVAVSGKINNIGVSLGRPHLIVGLTGDAMEHPALQCNFGKGESEKIATMSKGQAVKVTGKITGFLLLNVVASDCEVAP